MPLALIRVAGPGFVASFRDSEFDCHRFSKTKSMVKPPDSLGKIPGVCNAVKVECINLMQLIDGADWVLG